MKDQKVKPHDTVDVVATEFAQSMKPGKTYKLHRIAAQKLVDRGLVTYAK